MVLVTCIKILSSPFHVSFFCPPHSHPLATSFTPYTDTHQHSFVYLLLQPPTLSSITSSLSWISWTMVAVKCTLISSKTTSLSFSSNPVLSINVFYNGCGQSKDHLSMVQQVRHDQDQDWDASDSAKTMLKHPFTVQNCTVHPFTFQNMDNA